VKNEEGYIFLLGQKKGEGRELLLRDVMWGEHARSEQSYDPMVLWCYGPVEIRYNQRLGKGLPDVTRARIGYNH